MTHPDFFGWVPSSGPDGRPEIVEATPLDYIRRWQLANEVLGDDVKLEGVVVEARRLSAVISQPAIRGGLASRREIDEMMTELGFRPIRGFDMGAELGSSYYDPAAKIGIFDAAADNVISSDGVAVPVDVVLHEVSEALHGQLMGMLG